jgi:ubiquinone biosynthesis protein COQ9
MKIRERITALVCFRIEEASRNADALRRAIAILSRPDNALKASALGWRAADMMWRTAGDTSVDFAWYTKRTTLATVYTATLLAWMDDDSEGFVETRHFLDRRIEDVMSFERMKARLRPDPNRHFSISRFLGRLRYPPRQ